MPITTEAKPIGYNDGYLGVPRRVGVREFEYPYKYLGDLDTFIVTETWKASLGVYRPTPTGSVHALWSTAYLVRETKPAPNGLGAEKWQRIYAKIPPDQVDYGFVDFTRPVMDNIKDPSGAWAVTFDGGVTSHVFTSRKVVNRVSSFPATSISAVLPSSNITFSDGTNTVNVPANSNKAAAEAILAGLTLLSGISVTVGSNIMSLVWTGTMVSIITPAGVTIASSGAYWAGFKSMGTGNTPATTLINASANGAVVGDWVAFWAGDKLVGFSQVVTITDADNFSVMTAGLNASDTIITNCAFAKNGVRYVAGLKKVKARITTKFYWPGVTAGISTGADIPAPLVVTRDPINYLAQIISAVAYAVDGVTTLRDYPDAPSPFKAVDITELLMSDAKDTASASA